ncbi:phage tail assembly protein [Vibrio ruber]|nr:phage tail assembly protein [Vibrio ruber]WNJ96537.1 phage tail assembly protein [Vibrio ruber]
MAKHEFSFRHGLMFGKGKDAEPQYDVVLRELTSADLIDAAMEAERVVFVDEGKKAIAYTSEVLYGFELLRRQISSVGEIQGPLTFKQLRQLHPDDLQTLQDETEKLDGLIKGVSERGRDVPA